MELYAVFHIEEYVGNFFQGIFSSMDNAQYYIDNVSEYPSSELFIYSVVLDENL